MYTDLPFLGQIFNKGHLFQMDIEDNIPTILSKKGEKINIIVVGAWHGDEIQSFLHYGDVHIFAFEPNPTNYNYLQKRYSGNKKVTCFNIACGEIEDTLTLYEGTITGNDSLLPIKDSERMQTKQTHQVSVKRLDSFKELKDLPIHLLWADVQGYELTVLKRATSILPNIDSLFLEVNEDDRTYKDTTIFKDLDLFLEENNYRLAHKEIDSKDNTGNAFYLKKTITTDFFSKHKEYTIRIQASLTRRSNFIFSNKILRKYASILIPTSLRATIKKVLHL